MILIIERQYATVFAECLIVTIQNQWEWYEKVKKKRIDYIKKGGAVNPASQYITMDEKATVYAEGKIIFQHPAKKPRRKK